MKELDELVKDQPMKPLDKAIWWLEYVITHNDTKHLFGPYFGKQFYHHMFEPDVTAVFAILLLTIAMFTIKFVIFFVCILLTRKIEANLKKN